MFGGLGVYNVSSYFVFFFSHHHTSHVARFNARGLSYGPPWAHYLGGYQDRLLGGPLGLPGLRYTAPEGVEHKDYTGVVLG
jgi:hypothetical protein